MSSQRLRLVEGAAHHQTLILTVDVDPGDRLVAACGRRADFIVTARSDRGVDRPESRYSIT